MKIKNITWLTILLMTILVGAPRRAAAVRACTAAQFNDWNSFPCLPGLSGNQSTCSQCTGMPRWSVDEPYINLHVTDTPLTYKTSSGQNMDFTFNYKMRYMLPMADQVPDLYFIGGISSISARNGVNDYYMLQMRNEGFISGTNAFYSTSAAWIHNWMVDVMFWDAPWEAAAFVARVNHTTFPSTAHVFLTNYEGVIISPSGGIDYFNYNEFSGTPVTDPTSQASLVPQSGSQPTVSTNVGMTNGIAWGNTTNGLKRIYADGSQDVFGLCFWGSFTGGPGSPLNIETTAHSLLSQRIDPQGRVTKVGYEYTNFTGYIVPVYRVKYVVDPDGRTNTFVYNTNSPHTPWELQEIDDPYGRKTSLTYDSSGRLSSITDAAGISNSFAYTTFQTTNFWLNQLTTPYGPTKFYFDQQTDPSTTNQNSFIERALYVSEPDSAQQLYCYIHQATSGVPASVTSPTNIPDHTDFDDGTHTIADQALTFRDTFRWGRRQAANLSSTVQSDITNLNSGGTLATVISALSSNDFQKAHLSHWLLAPTSSGDTSMDTSLPGDGLSVTDFISDEREPSPDAAGNTTGAWTFYDYANKYEGAVSAGDPTVTCVARILPDGTSQYTRYTYFGPGYLAPQPDEVQDSETSITLPNGSLGEITNYFNYNTANGIDLTNVSNSAGQFINYAYNTNHQVTNITDAVGQKTVFTFDTTSHNLTSVTFPSGGTVSLGYYGSGAGTNLARLLDTTALQPQGLTNEAVDYSAGSPRVVHVSGTNLPDLWLTNAWDGLNRLTGITFADGTSISNIYTTLSLTAHQDRLGNWTHYGFDGLEHLTAVTNALNAVTTFSWCGCGSLTGVTDALTNTTSLNYDNQGRLTSVTFPDSSSLTYAFDLNGRMTGVADGSGNSVSLAYNNQDLVTNVSNANGVLSRVVFDTLNRPIQLTDANGVTVTNGYDLINRLTKRIWTVDGLGEAFGYATNGLIAYTNRDGQPTHFTRDNAGRLLAVTNANLEVTQFQYDGLSHLTTLIDGLTRTTAWNYNSFGWVTNKVDASNHVAFLYAYDADGRLTNRWMPASGNTAYVYDVVGNLTNIIYSNTPTAAISYAYDADNRLTNLIDGSGTNKFTWTQTGQLASETGPWPSNTVAYTYTQGHRNSLTLLQPTGGAWNQTYSYDNQWRMTNLASLAGTFGYGYPASASALIQSLALPDLANITYGYDSLARLTNTSLANYWGHVLDGYGYAYDHLGQKTSISRYLGLSTNSVTPAYDNIGQVTSWSGVETNGTLRLNEQLGYGYDAADNLHLRTNNALVQTFGVDSLNQLSMVTRVGTFTETGATPAPMSLSVNGVLAQTNKDFTFARTNLTLIDGNNSFTNVAQNVYGVTTTNTFTVNLPATSTFLYDGNGNLTNDGLRNFIYDAENQLTNVFVSNQWKTEFVYDGLKRKRIERDYTWQSESWLRTNETRYVYDRMLVVQERDTNNNPRVTYTRGLDLSLTLGNAGGIGGMLSRTDTHGSTFYHTDGNGNITSLIDGNQNIVARYEYDAFGRLIGKWGPLADANRYRFSSKEYIPQAGLYSYGYRFYEPSFQRWVNRDPIGIAGGMNLYRYVRNNPLSLSDVYGLSGTLLGGSVSSAAQAGPNAEMAQLTAEGDALLGAGETAAIGAGAEAAAAIGAGAVALGAVAGAAWLEQQIEQLPPNPATYNYTPELNPNGVNSGPDTVTYPQRGFIGSNGEYQDADGNTRDANGNIIRDKHGRTCKMVSNPKHNPNSQNPEPPNAQDLFNNSIPDPDNPDRKRWALDDDGEIHRFMNDGNGDWHWNGSTADASPIQDNNIPNSVQRALGY